MLLLMVPMAFARVTPAAALTVDAGVCELDITVTSGTSVPRVPPSTRTWTLGGGGTCDTTRDDNVPVTVSGTLSGLLDQATVTCAAAVLDGAVFIEFTHDDYPNESLDLASFVIVAGAAVAMAGVEVASVAAAGVFEQTGAVEPCAGGSISGATWSGALAFGDPVL